MRNVNDSFKNVCNFFGKSVLPSTFSRFLHTKEFMCALFIHSYLIDQYKQKKSSSEKNLLSGDLIKELEGRQSGKRGVYFKDYHHSDIGSLQSIDVGFFYDESNQTIVTCTSDVSYELCECHSRATELVEFEQACTLTDFADWHLRCVQKCAESDFDEIIFPLPVTVIQFARVKFGNWWSEWIHKHLLNDLRECLLDYLIGTSA